MHYVFMNIRLFKRNSRLIFVLIIILQVLSAVSVVFAYGVYCNYRYERSSEFIESTGLAFYFDEEIRLADIKAAMVEVPEEILTEADLIQLFSVYALDDSGNISEPLVDEINERFESGIYTLGDTGYIYVDIDMQYDPEKLEYVYEHKKYDFCREHIAEGEFIDNEDYSSGAKQLYFCKGSRFAPAVGSTVELCGEIFEVAGRFLTLDEHPDDQIVLSYYAAPDDIRVRSLSYYYDGFVPKTYYDRTVGIFKSRFGDMVHIQEPDELEIEDHNYYTTVMAIAVMFIVIPVINIGILLFYVVSIRNRMAAVFRIEGGTRGSIVLMFMKEYMLITAIDNAVGLALFRFLLYPLFKPRFAYFDSIYDIAVYPIFYGIMLSVTAFVLFVMLRLAVSKTPIGQIKGAVK